MAAALVCWVERPLEVALEKSRWFARRRCDFTGLTLPTTYHLVDVISPFLCLLADLDAVWQWGRDLPTICTD